MIEATGKGVAIDGESDSNDPDDESGYVRYLVGEDIQNAVRKTVEESVGADLERYERDGLTPAWVSRQDKPVDPEVSVTEWASDPQQRAWLERCDRFSGSELSPGLCEMCHEPFDQHR